LELGEAVREIRIATQDEQENMARTRVRTTILSAIDDYSADGGGYTATARDRDRMCALVDVLLRALESGKHSYVSIEDELDKLAED
jgi:hypothetical protein